MFCFYFFQFFSFFLESWLQTQPKQMRSNQTKLKLITSNQTQTVLIQPNQTLGLSVHDLHTNIKTSKNNWNLPNFAKWNLTKQNQNLTNPKQSKTLNKTLSYLNEYEMSKSAAQLLYGPVLVVWFVYIRICFCLFNCNPRWTDWRPGWIGSRRSWTRCTAGCNR